MIESHNTKQSNHSPQRCPWSAHGCYTERTNTQLKNRYDPGIRSYLKDSPLTAFLSQKDAASKFKQSMCPLSILIRALPQRCVATRGPNLMSTFPTLGYLRAIIDVLTKTSRSAPPCHHYKIDDAPFVGGTHQRYPDKCSFAPQIIDPKVNNEFFLDLKTGNSWLGHKITPAGNTSLIPLLVFRSL
jgi:hypothetical protein